MKKDSKRLFNTLIGVVAVIATVSIIIVLVNQYQVEQMPFSDNPIIDDGTGANNGGKSKAPDNKEMRRYEMVPSANIKDIGEPVRQRNDAFNSDLTITLNKVIKTKSLKDVGLSESDFAVAPYGKNENGEYPYSTFVFLDLTIKNNTNEPCEDYISYDLKINSYYDDTGSEAMYKNIVHTQLDKAYWLTKFGPYEELNILYGYQIYDSVVNDKNLLLGLSNFGTYSSKSDGDQYYIAINGKE